MKLSRCPFCGSDAPERWVARVLGRYEATFHQCDGCGSAHVAEPTWLNEAYADVIARTDVGLAARCLWTSNATIAVIRRWFPRARRFCDFGGGTGLFVRMMRDAGFDFAWDDPYADNQFAAGHEAVSGATFDLMTAFEVIEHVPEPREVVARAQAVGASLLVSTDLLPSPMPAPDEWDYYSLLTGQHIRFASREGLRQLGMEFGYQVSSAGTLHLFAPFRVPAAELRVLTSRPVSRFLAPILGRSSLLASDASQATEDLAAELSRAR